MKFTISLWIACFSLIICMCSAVSHFKECATKQLNDDTSLQCKIQKLQVDGNMPKVKDYMNCAFETSGWTQKDGKNLDTSKVTQDMVPYGFNIKDKLDEVTKECETEFGAEISAIDYLACLLIDDRTKTQFKTMLMMKEADFFKQNLCK